MEDLDANDSPTKKELIDLLLGGEGREDSRKACGGCQEEKYA